MTQIGTFHLSSGFHSSISSFEIDDLNVNFFFGIEIAFHYIRKFKTRHWETGFYLNEYEGSMDT